MSPGSGGQKCKIKVWQGHTSSRGSRGVSSLPLPASRGSGLPWLVAASLQPLSPSSRGLLPVSSFCVCLGTAVHPAGSPSLDYLLFSCDCAEGSSLLTRPHQGSLLPTGLLSTDLTPDLLHLSEGGISMLITGNSTGEICLFPCVFVYLTIYISTDAWAFTF